jgi:hypothetical protein
MTPGCDNGEGALESAAIIVSVALVVVAVEVEEMVPGPEGLVGGGVGSMATAPADVR